MGQLRVGARSGTKAGLYGIAVVAISPQRPVAILCAVVGFSCISSLVSFFSTDYCGLMVGLWVRLVRLVTMCETMGETSGSHD